MSTEKHNSLPNIADIIVSARVQMGLAIDGMLEASDGRAFDNDEREVWHDLLTARDFIDAAAKRALAHSNALVDALRADEKEGE